MAGAVTQAQGMACLGIHLQCYLRADSKLVGTGEGMHHHESPALGAPLDRDGLIHEQLACRADGPHAAGADGRFPPSQCTVPWSPG